MYPVPGDNKKLKKIRSNLLTHKYLYPTNFTSEKVKFFKDTKYNPQLNYRPFPKETFRRFEKELEHLKPPNTHSFTSKIYKDKIKETKLKLKLFFSIGTTALTSTSSQLYGLKFGKKTLKTAYKDSLTCKTFKSENHPTRDETADAISGYLKKQNILGWKVKLSKRSDFYFQIFPKKKLIKIGKHINWEGADLEYFLAHEIDGHVIRTQNASLQKKKIFTGAFPFYIKTEEGLASYLGNYHSKNGKISRCNHAIRYLAGYFAKTHTFSQTYKFLLDYGFSPEPAFLKTFRLKRGFTDTSVPGVFAREAIYYEGMLDVKNYLDEGGDVRKLFAGKVGLSDCANIPVPKKQILPRRLTQS